MVAAAAASASSGGCACATAEEELAAEEAQRDSPDLADGAGSHWERRSRQSSGAESEV